MKVLVSDPLSKEGLKELKKEKKLVVEVKCDLSPQELKKVIKDYDGIIIRSGTNLTRDIINNAKKLKVIGRAGVGLDNIDVEAATQRGIIVMSAPGANTISTAEHTMSLILSLSRNIPRANESLRQSKWDRKKFMGVELHEKTLGIIGLGRIGQEVAKRALSFGMKVIANDPFLSLEVAKRLEVRLVGLKELLKRSDYVSLHFPLTDETHHLIGEKEFRLMKKGARIINCARGGIIDEDALYRAIKKGKIAGAALDVFEKEPPTDNPLLLLDSVVVTPHLGASTEQAQVKVAIDIARQMADALLDRGVRNAVNMPSMAPEVCKEIQPYIILAEKLGSLETQLIEGRLKRVKIRYCGDIIGCELAPITLALIKGLLAPIVKDTVNYVNAPVIAKERGIEVVETKSSAALDFANLITVDAETDKMKSTLAGTLFGKSDPRIVIIDGYHVDVIPSGYMLIVYNVDKPGIIGELGTVMGENGINIASMTFGRRKKGGDAITVLNVDSAVPPKLLERMKTFNYIQDIKLVKL